jgi:hypothetical protein
MPAVSAAVWRLMNAGFGTIESAGAGYGPRAFELGDSAT